MVTEHYAYKITFGRYLSTRSTLFIRKFSMKKTLKYVRTCEEFVFYHITVHKVGMTNKPNQNSYPLPFLANKKQHNVSFIVMENNEFYWTHFLTDMNCVQSPSSVVFCKMLLTTTKLVMVKTLVIGKKIKKSPPTDDSQEVFILKFISILPWMCEIINSICDCQWDLMNEFHSWSLNATAINCFWIVHYDISDLNSTK